MVSFRHRRSHSYQRVISTVPRQGRLIFKMIRRALCKVGRGSSRRWSIGTLWTMIKMILILEVVSSFKIYELINSKFLILITSSMTSPSAISIGDDFSTCQSSITVWATDHKSARGVHMIYGIVIQVFGWDNCTNHMFH